MAIQDNQVVSIEYKAVDVGSGEVVDSNIGSHPLEFLVGRNQIIIGLENAIRGLSNGDSSDILVKAADGYGEYNSEAVEVLPREQFAGIDLVNGMTLYGQSEDGQSIPVTVKEYTETEVTIDFNHPMAGKDLMFSVKILDVRDADDSEITSGCVTSYGHGGGSCGTGGGSCGCH